MKRITAAEADALRMIDAAGLKLLSTPAAPESCHVWIDTKKRALKIAAPDGFIELAAANPADTERLAATIAAMIGASTEETGNA